MSFSSFYNSVIIAADYYYGAAIVFNTREIPVVKCGWFDELLLKSTNNELFCYVCADIYENDELCGNIVILEGP